MLPDWFDLKKYANVYYFSPEDWLRNLTERKRFLSYFERINEPKHANMCQKLYDSITENPIKCKDSKVKVSFSHKGGGIGFGNETVRPLSNSMLLDHYDDAKAKAPDGFNKYISEKYCKKPGSFKDRVRAVKLAEKNMEKNKALKNYLDGKFEPNMLMNGQLSVVEVRVHASDKHIIEGFTQWLKKQRQSTQIIPYKRLFTDKDFKEWADFKVLPYLDLNMHMLFTKQRFYLHTLGEELFTDISDEDVDTTDRVRRTVKKKANWLMKSEVLNGLSLQIKRSL